MSFLPQNTDLGELDIIEIYSYYNGARLFSCRNAALNIYFALWIDEDTDFDLWLYVPVSPKRCQEIRSGEIDLRNAFLKSEDGFVFVVKIFFDNSDMANYIKSEEIDKDWLPLPGDYLKLSSLYLPQA
ncbi:hypothetical protein NIES4071_52250 [Calothrix sp. NIES-4071]|nr:hypothetical protein NIES4071_52250 [Calothrix sp. NIES-4071]BAZ59533.1 hypothetical protein NIES4105_52200 [Calothrix sp. NIES-4105]